MITSTQPVCVVIPVYTTELSLSEKVSLERCVAVLGRHPIILAKPESLTATRLINRYPSLLHRSFPDKFFTNIEAYNRMMLSEEFYARFADYEHILIHQLDAFVFEDRLLHWCSLSYDYVGAPWLPPGSVPNFAKLALLAARRRYYQVCNLESLCEHTHDPQFSYAVGNGGFSLRRVSSLVRALEKFRFRAEQHRAISIRAWAEDLFFSVEANRYRRHIRIPSAKQAAFFSWETSPSVAIQLTNGQLPFGCHGWNKLHREDWRPIFAHFGYSIDALVD